MPLQSENLTAKNESENLKFADESQTEIHRNNFAANDYKTNIIDQTFNNSEKNGSRKTVFAVGAVLSLLLLFLGASAFYFMNQNKSDTNSPKQDETELNNGPTELKIGVENSNLNFQNDKQQYQDGNGKFESEF